MITENGSIKVGTPVNGAMYRETSKNAVLSCVFMIVVGAVVAVINVFTEWIAGIVIGAVLILFFAMLLGGVKKNAKEADKVLRVNTYEFFQDRFGAVQRVGGEIIDSEIVYYHTLVRAKETAHYILFYKNGNMFYPVTKDGLSDAELNTLRAIGRLRVTGPTLPLPAAVLVLPPYAVTLLPNNPYGYAPAPQYATPTPAPFGDGNPTAENQPTTDGEFSQAPAPENDTAPAEQTSAAPNPRGEEDETADKTEQ